MADYYLDIETYSKTPEPDMQNDQILTIQYQRIDSRTGQKKDELKILRAWESTEEKILRDFYDVFKPVPEKKWDFVPVGYNLSFDFASLLLRWQKIGINVPSRNLFSEKCYIDLQSSLILCNSGKFSGSALGKFIGKQHSGKKVAEWYDQKDYASIQKYIEEEVEGFISLYQHLVRELPGVWRGWAKEKGIVV